MLCLSYYCLYSVFNKIRDKGRTVSAWNWGGWKGGERIGPNIVWKKEKENPEVSFLLLLLKCLTLASNSSNAHTYTHECTHTYQLTPYPLLSISQCLWIGKSSHGVLLNAECLVSPVSFARCRWGLIRLAIRGIISLTHSSHCTILATFNWFYSTKR
jgi:hypothetical protein